MAPEHPRLRIDVLGWNLFHGRDAPPDRSLFTRRSRLLGATEANETHVQVNRLLREEFGARLASAEWDVALLQEAPPRWFRELCARSAASGALALTSRNLLPGLRALVADRNPDLIASGEGGSNQLLVRAPWRIAEVRRLTLARRPERRRMLWARLDGPRGLAVANLHASVFEHDPATDVLRAARAAHEWSGPLPLVFGGDLNMRPTTHAAAFEELSRRFGLAPPTAPGAVDHLLVRGLEVVERPRQLPASWRELDAGGGRALKLSDHAPVAAAFGMR